MFRFRGESGHDILRRESFSDTRQRSRFSNSVSAGDGPTSGEHLRFTVDQDIRGVLSSLL
jgi:hypothetical protein